MVKTILTENISCSPDLKVLTHQRHRSEHSQKVRSPSHHSNYSLPIEREGKRREINFSLSQSLFIEHPLCFFIEVQ